MTNSLSPRLKEQLDQSQFEDVPGLINHLFPDNVLPLSGDVLSKHIKSKKYEHWHSVKRTWNKLPDLDSYAEGGGPAALADFLNPIGSSLREVCQKLKVEDRIPAKARVWADATNAKASFYSSETPRKPGLCLVDAGEPLSWKAAQATAEYTSNDYGLDGLVVRLTKNASLTFLTQGGRRFKIGISFVAYSVRVYVFDRSGIVGSTAFDMRKSLHLLVRIIAGLTLTKPGAIGFDPTITYRDSKRFMVVDGKEYEILETLSTCDAIRGRGAVCWRARYEGVEYVIKDVWWNTSHHHMEPVIMAEASDIEDVVKLVTTITVENGVDKQGSTEYIREIIDRKTHPERRWLRDLETREHRRMVITPVGKTLSHFSSKRELLSVLIDAIIAHEKLSEKGILHRDISIGNVMLYQPCARSIDTSDGGSPPSLATSPESSNTMRRGLIIDFDRAHLIGDFRSEKTTDPTGTVPFMAIEVLRDIDMDGKYIDHSPRHDLESFFYILLWMCWNYVGPNDAKRQNFDIFKSVAKRWLSFDEMYIILGDFKLMCFSSPTSFDQVVLSLVAPYFDDLKPCLRKIRDIIYDSSVEHQDVVKILKDTMAELPVDEKWSPQDDEVGYGLDASQKRKHDDAFPEDDGPDGEEDRIMSPPKKRVATSTVSHA